MRKLLLRLASALPIDPPELIIFAHIEIGNDAQIPKSQAPTLKMGAWVP
jgi:hypothetical protein